MPETKKSKTVIIAIDGYSSCGKSTLAKQLAKKLEFAYIDTGAMYRAVTLYFLRQKVNLLNSVEVADGLESINICFKNIDGLNTTWLNDENVESGIRSMEVSEKVSEVAAISAVRTKLVNLQREMSGSKGLVMDGRDIGTVVFPDADVKFFLTADTKIRAQRRYDELKAKNQKAEFDEVMANLQHRDHIDSTRSDSPLKKASDAIVIDNTYLTIQGQFDLAMEYVEKILVQKN